MMVLRRGCSVAGGGCFSVAFAIAMGRWVCLSPDPNQFLASWKYETVTGHTIRAETFGERMVTSEEEEVVEVVDVVLEYCWFAVVWN